MSEHDFQDIEPTEPDLINSASWDKPAQMKRAAPGCLIPFLLSPILFGIFSLEMKESTQAIESNPGAPVTVLAILCGIALLGFGLTAWTFFGKRPIRMPLIVRLTVMLLYTAWLVALGGFLWQEMAVAG